MAMALLMQSQDDFVKELANAGSKPVVVAFIKMSDTKFAAAYSGVVSQLPATMVFLLVMVDAGPAAQEIADTNGAGAPPSLLFFLNNEKVTSFPDPEAQKVLKKLQETLAQ